MKKTDTWHAGTMKKLTDYRKINHLRDQIEIEKVYPLSIIEGIQKGEIFVDNEEAPTASLIWHYCGFANILGGYDEKFIEETMLMMQNPPDGHSGRMALQTENDLQLQDMILKTPGVSNDYVDIGVETADECRGKGYGKFVAAAMVKETLRRGKTPVWDCDTRNEASMRLACSVGFEIVGTHAWYKFEG